MINQDRIVPVTATDLLTLYSIILLQDSNNSAMTKLAAEDIEGNFKVTTTGIKIANQPVKSCNFTASSGTLYFVADYAYEGFLTNGSAATIADNDVTVEKDGRTLYKAVLATGTVTITQIGF